ncbi:aldehyde dehydrogenase [Lawsonibacter faecis]|uniref:Aldehyde dehydrogenase n=1 Tax=Lawsonibacter faecis TaxID=2763052 RepID=A0A8J6JEK7_9FIRM|nr:MULTISPECIES: aldehyde dehydrogenase [Oscillospiraceae]MTQ96225.1 aldehyde dehydrogenase family protein [Pseudoflavonifractor sp. BIOML-A16]MTR06913.1 aldehyde dehydrogenase family protein [Pseudoflavonifractor sp. BIOML-A15]MTR73637.1 aldehyde dehydrogenase family protein [Pseudoflavonifractor sp. BIOML-A18]MTS65214.1 aldehyde dehydrogenase family protein [Pseudoflavonifractor sp. BIOML-A5]MTS71166.1 aldehyde dehydrogenase family protein [Pseudoflavonifractor sp. BIOML-A8]
MDLKELVSAQRRYWNSGATRSVGFRRDMLEKLERAVVSRERELLSALREDLGKAPYESYACEVGMTLAELRCAKSHLTRWAAPKGRPSPMALFPAKSRVVADPYGVALIMSPWNYPVQLTLVPLISALAAGNCAVVKPSAYAPACSAVLKALISDIFPREYAAVVEGGRAENSALLEERFDYIFFTGSTEVGRTVMRAAAEFLTPVTLELGGKSPVIIGEDADLKLAARRLAWGKFLNAGQTCVAPDHVWVPEGMRDALVEELGKQIRALYGENPLESPDLPKIVNEKHFNRVNGLIQREKTAIGGKSDPVTRRIEPTVLVDVTETDAVMGDEIFGPVLPILTYTDLEELLARQQQKPRPLALYLFTRDRRAEERILRMVPSGGVCVNDTVVHLANPNVPFGGVGASGMGACHGKAGFDTFTHYRTVVRRGALDLPVRYPPYGGKGLGLLKKLM